MEEQDKPMTPKEALEAVRKIEEAFDNLIKSMKRLAESLERLVEDACRQ
jgi:hypothetical protein